MNTSRGQAIVSNILAIAGFIILIAIVVWGAYHFFNIVSSGFSSLISRTGTRTIVVTPAVETIGTGEPLDLSWDYTPPEGDGAYALLYECRAGFEFRIPTATSTTEAIPCGGAYPIGGPTAESIRVVPMLAEGESLAVPFSVVYLTAPTSATSTPTTRASGSASITVTKAPTMAAGGTGTTGGSTQTETPVIRPITPTAPVTPERPASTPIIPATPTPRVSGPADLAIRVLAVGVIDYTGNFVARTPVSPEEVVAVKFDIRNQGGTATGPWYFSVDIPTSTAMPYYSPAQRSLNPGDRIENILRFTDILPGGGTLSVFVDPANSVSESNESNNVMQQWISGGNYYSPTYQYQQYGYDHYQYQEWQYPHYQYGNQYSY